MEEFLHYLTLPYLLQGTLFTLQLTGLGFAGGLVLGIMLAWMQLSRFRVLSGTARGYTVIYRGTPLILQLVFVFTALPHIGIVLPPMVAGGVALAMNEATFLRNFSGPLSSAWIAAKFPPDGRWAWNPGG